MSTPKLIVRRRFAVWLEDALEVDAPTEAALADHDGDVEAWAIANYDDIFARAADDDPSAAVLWEDQFKADLDFPESEITVEPSYTARDTSGVTAADILAKHEPTNAGAEATQIGPA